MANATEGNKLNDYESDTPKQLTDSPNADKFSGTDNITESDLASNSCHKAQDPILCGKKHSHAREDIRNLNTSRGEGEIKSEDKVQQQSEFSAKE